MRLNKIVFCMLMALPTLLLQSCLKDQEDIFDAPSSLRLQEVLDNAKTVLTSSVEGWAFDYYPDRTLSYGGYVYTVKFDNQKATVGSELDPGTFESSYYKLTSDNGPVLSFDSYNTLMHFFATPSSTLYEAYDGDFEFIIMSVTDDLITLRGKRTGNTMYLRRLVQTPDAYIDAVLNVVDNIIISSANGTAGALALSCAIDMDSRWADFTYMKGEETVTVSQCFIVSETGIHFYKPIEINGATVSELVYNANDLTFIGRDSKGNDITLTGVLAADYTPFDEFEGEYTINYYWTPPLEVTLVPDKANNRYLIRGLNPNFDVVANYVKAKGYLSITSQKVGDSGTQQIWFCGWAAATGRFSWSTECGMYIVKDTQKADTYNFVTNNYSGLLADSFILYVFNGAPSEDTAVGGATAPWLIDGDYRIPYLETLVKK